MELIEQVPVGTLTVYIGDDETDEDAFRVLGDRGVGIKVGPSVDGTAAGMSLADCAAVRSFLQTWQHGMTTGDAAG
jgi:trehalose-6-phosphatase